MDTGIAEQQKKSAVVRLRKQARRSCVMSPRLFYRRAMTHQIVLGLLLSSFLPLHAHAISTNINLIPTPEQKEARKQGDGVHFQEVDTQKPALITAESMHYDEPAGLVIAAGKVEVLQENRILLADAITYNQKTNMVIAKGHVSLMEPAGDVFFAEELELADSLKEGVVNGFKARFRDNSLMVAKTAKRLSEKVTVLEKAVYSPCSICDKKGNPHMPQWQIKADKATINQQEERIKYKNAFFEVYGVPVFYTPFFSHATPKASARSGFLIPTYGSITNLGGVAKIPYYVTFAPNMDMTLTPYLTSKQGPVMHTEFRHLIEQGSYDLKGSITNPEDNKVDASGHRQPGRRLRWHVEGSGRFQLDPLWDAGFDMKHASDDTYLRRYKFGEEDYLTSRLYTERMEDRDYTVIQSLTFQELNNIPDAPRTPVILPMITSHVEKKLGTQGDKLVLDSNLLILSRREGTDTRRISLTGSWQKPYMTNGGHVFQFSTSLRGDLYSVNNVQQPHNATTRKLEGVTSRAIPEARVDWRFPLVKNNHSHQIFLEPMANMIISPYGSNPDKIPNEDSQAVELSDDNLFSSNRYSGLDRVESGPRTNYGIRAGLETEGGRRINMLLGQSYRIRAERNLQPVNGIDDTFSDYVGRISIVPAEKMDLTYRFRLDKETFVAHHNEVNTTLNLHPVNLHVSYLALNEAAPTVTPNREEIYSAASLALSNEWTIGGDARKNLVSKGGMISASSNLSYYGDCLDASAVLSREFLRDRDIVPATSITFQIFLKNLH